MNEQLIAKKIRELRKKAGLTVTAAARKADLTKSALSKIETAQISPPISTMIRIAKALGVPLAEFFVDEENDPACVFTPKNARQVVSQKGSQFGYRYEALAPGKRNKNAEPFVLTIEPEDPPGEFFHRGQEFIYMLTGIIDFTVGDNTYRMKAGDSIYFDSGIKHRTQVVGRKKATFVTVFIQGD
ncbi:MAG: helix-turn-helix domain-containing protein [Actinobacteria bacterium]|nr:helix-turn-helix domain-containing protein [Actinomycetota bacterium]